MFTPRNSDSAQTDALTHGSIFTSITDEIYRFKSVTLSNLSLKIIIYASRFYLLIFWKKNLACTDVIIIPLYTVYDMHSEVAQVSEQRRQVQTGLVSLLTPQNSLKGARLLCASREAQLEDVTGHVCSALCPH